MPAQCYWEECKVVKRDKTALLRHMYTKHWSFAVREFVCEYCKKGYNDEASMSSHVRAATHLEAEQNNNRYHAKEFALQWIKKNWLNKTLSEEHHHHLNSYEQKTQDDLEDEMLIPPYTPSHPGLDATATKVSATAEPMDNTPQTNTTDETPLSPVSSPTPQTSAVNQCDTNPTTTENQSAPTDTPNAPNPAMNQATAETPPTSSTLSPPGHPSSSCAPQSSVPNTTPKKHPTPLLHPFPPTCLNLQDGSPPPKRRKLQDQLEHAEDITQMIYIIAKSIDDQADRIDNLELRLKQKFKEITYDQSRHLVGMMQSIAQAESFRTKSYMRELMVSLQNDLVMMGK